MTIMMPLSALPGRICILSKAGKADPEDTQDTCALAVNLCLLQISKAWRSSTARHCYYVCGGGWSWCLGPGILEGRIWLQLQVLHTL